MNLDFQMLLQKLVGIIAAAASAYAKGRNPTYLREMMRSIGQTIFVGSGGLLIAPLCDVNVHPAGLCLALLGLAFGLFLAYLGLEE
ncbi:hypothetical protein [Sinimarinibacterium sp. NLF-5-8]|uniref:hypothetical protein n=1 Tax=Sinimarinibacterium sp. NLF-5-8 TaxID=2698684 RepID=UPI00137C1950|nr:hypothetical protein [Sinimarinibacterium sp. NLF-5-8]QHS09145.1 hypothetical protein GT972_02560 [Sinimarinibacterium sp. NLF-5-8]